MITIADIIYVLKESVERNGEKPLTNKWLLNILKLVVKRDGELEKSAELYSHKNDWLY